MESTYCSPFSPIYWHVPLCTLISNCCPQVIIRSRFYSWGMQAGALTSKLLAFLFPLRGIAGQLKTINKTIQITRTLVFSGIIRHLHSTKLLSEPMQRAPAIKNKRKTNYTLKKKFLQIDPFQYSNKQNSNRHTSGPIISNFFRCNIWWLDAHDIQLILF